MTEIDNIQDSIATTSSAVVTATSTALLGRELSSAINTPELLEQHNKINGNKVRTR